jgi:hypothetical protein
VSSNFSPHWNAMVSGTPSGMFEMVRIKHPDDIIGAQCHQVMACSSDFELNRMNLLNLAAVIFRECVHISVVEKLGKDLEFFDGLWVHAQKPAR